MKLLPTILFTLLLHIAYAQGSVWNEELPIHLQTNIPQISLQSYGDQYLVSGQKNILTLNQLGEITGAILPLFNGALSGFGSFIRPKTDLQTGEKYFLLATTKFGATNALSIYEYRPGQGFGQETMLEELFGSSAFSPVFVDLNDSAYFVLGRKYFRQITHRPGIGVVTNWEKINALGNPNAGVKTPEGIVGVSQNGIVFALDATGNILWSTPTAYILQDIQVDDNGFLAVGRTADSSAVIVKLSPSGAIIWTKKYDDDFIYNHLLRETDGSLTVVGQSDALQVVLRHLAADGTSIWRNTYQEGSGRSTLRLDSGYLVAGQSKQYNRSFVLRTDLTGYTKPVETLLNPQNRKVDNGHLRTIAMPSSSLFFDGQSGLVVPQDNSAGLFYAAAPWLGAFDQDSALHLSVATYSSDTLREYRNGFSQGPAADFQRVWLVSRSQIETLRHDWADNGILDQPVSYDISTWPAKGNVKFATNLNFTQTTTDKSLLPAPFVDLNGDGLYNPADGDYPRIKGDQMAWWILTDSTAHTISDGQPLVVDLGVSMYLYDCDQNISLGRSLFVDYEVINRSSNAYHQMFAGVWADPDLGCPYDDYVGTLPAANAMYAYNRDVLDGTDTTDCPNSTITFNNPPPVGSLSFINATLDKSVYFQTAPPLPYPNYLPPYPDNLLYKFLLGSVTPAGQPTDFFFPGNPAAQDNQSMCATGNPAYPSDYRFLGSHGPFQLAPNDTFRLTIAFTYHPNIPLPCPDISGTVKNDLDQLHELVNSGALAAPPHLLTYAQIAPGQSVTLDASVVGATDYNWSNGATTATITVDQPGEYSVTITRATGCASIETVLVTAATPTQEAAWLDQLRLFPNPNTGQFQVEVQGAAQNELEFVLVNALGQVVQRQVADFRSGTLRRHFDCGNFPTGMYTLQVRSGEKTRFVKVVLQR